MADSFTSKSHVPNPEGTATKEASTAHHEGEWKTAGAKVKAKTGRKSGQPAHAGSSPHRSLRTPAKGAAPKTEVRVGLKEGHAKGASKDKVCGGDQGDGAAIFEQLKAYASNSAPDHYVVDLVIRLKDHAKERRYASFRKRTKQNDKESDPKELRAQWEDAMPQQLRYKYQRIDSQWEAANEEHQNKLAHLMRTWRRSRKVSWKLACASSISPCQKRLLKLRGTPWW